MKGYWLSVYEKVADPEIQKKSANCRGCLVLNC